MRLTMAKTAKCCIKFLLKFVNVSVGIIGISMILYSIWFARVWQREMEGTSSDHDYNFSSPWFIHAFLGVGIALWAITCLGHIAANTEHACCLSSYMVIVFLLLLVETALIADIFLNSDWKKDLPQDPTGRFDDFKDFVKSNFDTCKWIAMLIVLAQGCSILLATVLRTLQKDQGRSYDSDDDYAAPRVPFRNDPMQPLPRTAADLPFSGKNGTWKVKGLELR